MVLFRRVSISFEVAISYTELFPGFALADDSHRANICPSSHSHPMAGYTIAGFPGLRGHVTTLPMLFIDDFGRKLSFSQQMIEKLSAQRCWLAAQRTLVAIANHLTASNFRIFPRRTLHN